MVHHLTRGRLRAALSANPVMLIAGLPLLGWLWVRWYRAEREGRRPAPLPKPVAFTILGVALGWMAVRNLVASD